MAVRLSPGVFINEIDKTLGMNLIGNGSIGIAAKLNKGPIGKPFLVTSQNELISVGGYPLPGFNLTSWHSIDNMLIYAGSVMISRAEKLEFDSKHDNSNQKFEIPVSSGQVGLHLSGNSSTFNFDEELQMMIKNREQFKTVNEDNIYDIKNEDNGIDISELDNSILIPNDDVLEEYVDNNGFNTKASKLSMIPHIGPRSVVKDDFVPNLEIGQVYNHNGKLVEIGSNIYDDHFILDVLSGVSVMKGGTGTVDVSVSNTITGTNTIFQSELKVGSVIDLTYYGGINTTMETLTRDASNYKLVTLSAVAPGLSVGDKLIVDDGVNVIERIISNINGLDVTLTVDALDWSGITYAYRSVANESRTVTNINSDTEIIVDGAPLTFVDATFTYRLEDSVSINDGIDAPLSSKLYLDENDATGKTILGVNVIFPVLLREGSKIVVDINGINYVRYVESIDGRSILTLTEPFLELTVDEADAKIFKYANFYFNSFDANIDKLIFGENGGVAKIVSSDETDNSPSNILRYVVKVIDGRFDKLETVSLSKLQSNEWDMMATNIRRSVEVSKENNLYFIRYDASNLDLERDDVVYFQSDDGVNKGLYTAKGLIYIATKSSDTDNNKNLVIELMDDDYIVDESTVNINDVLSEDIIYSATFVMGGAQATDGDTITIGNDVYEFSTVDPGTSNIWVDITGDTSVDDNISGLESAITANYPLTTTNHGSSLTFLVSSDYETYANLQISSVMTDSSNEWLAEDGVTPLNGSGNINQTTSTWASASAVNGSVGFIHMYENVLVYEKEAYDGDMLMVNDNINGLTSTLKNRYTYVYNYTGVDINDKYEYSVINTVNGNVIQSTEFLRVIARTPGAWVNDDNISISICDMDHFDTALVEEDGIRFSSLFQFAPDTSDKSLMAVAVIKDDVLLEKYIVSTNPQSTDAQGTSQYVLDIINNKSAYVRILLNTGVLAPNTGAAGYNISFNTIQNVKIEGGYSGKKFELYSSDYYNTSSTIDMNIENGYVEELDVNTALSVFRNKEDVGISYLVDGEWCGNPTIQNIMIDICEDRGDAIAILGPKMSIMLMITVCLAVEEIDNLRDSSQTSNK